MQGRQDIEGTGRLSSRRPSQLALLLLLTVQFQLVVLHREGAAGWSTQLRRGWVATGLSRWMGCSVPQGSRRGRESMNPAKMKLCPGCHNPFASNKLYKLFAVFFLHLDDGWFGTLGIQSVEMLPLNFFVRQKWYVGILGKTCCSCKKKKTSSNEKTKTQKYTNKQQNKKTKL